MGFIQAVRAAGGNKIHISGCECHAAAQLSLTPAGDVTTRQTENWDQQWAHVAPLLRWIQLFHSSLLDRGRGVSITNPQLLQYSSRSGWCPYCIPKTWHVFYGFYKPKSKKEQYENKRMQHWLNPTYFKAFLVKLICLHTRSFIFETCNSLWCFHSFSQHLKGGLPFRASEISSSFCFWCCYIIGFKTSTTFSFIRTGDRPVQQLYPRLPLLCLCNVSRKWFFFILLKSEWRRSVLEGRKCCQKIPGHLWKLARSSQNLDVGLVAENQSGWSFSSLVRTTQWSFLPKNIWNTDQEQKSERHLNINWH